MSFSTDLKVLQDFTEDKDALQKTVKGLVIDGFPSDGLSVGKAGTSFSGFTATCNVIGPNLGAGIRLADVAPAVIGADLAHGGTAGDYNVIATNSGDGIAFTKQATPVLIPDGSDRSTSLPQVVPPG